MDRSPAFQFYPKDWDSDEHVIPMTLEEEGVYWLLCRRYWLAGSLPADLDRLRALVKGRPTREQMEAWWINVGLCFRVRGDRLTHKRLDAERKKQAKNRKARQLAAEKRWEQEQSKRNANALHEQCLPSPSPSPSPIPTPVRKTQTRASRVTVVPDGFAAFWTAYPRHTKRADAEKAWVKLSPDAATQSAMQAALRWQSQSPDWTKDGGRYIPHPATWLNGKRWEDEPTTVVHAQRLSDAGRQSLLGLTAFRERMAAKAAGGEA